MNPKCGFKRPEPAPYFLSLSIGTGFIEFHSSFSLPRTGILKSHSSVLSTGTKIPALYQISGSQSEFGHPQSQGQT